MRDLPAAFIAAIKEDRVNVCEIFDFELTNGQIYRFTGHDEAIDWGTPSKRYTSLPIQRSSVTRELNLEVDSMELQLENITNELATVVHKNWLENVKVTVKRVLWDQNSASGLEMLVFYGTGTVTSFDRRILYMRVTSILNSLNTLVPANIYQEPCNYQIFDCGCTLAKADYKVSSTTTSAATDHNSVIDSAYIPPGTDLKKYFQGELKITSGANSGLRRMILSTEIGKFIVLVPFPELVESGVTFDYYPGCDGTPETCRDRFNNIVNYYGFIYMPRPEELLW